MDHAGPNDHATSDGDLLDRLALGDESAFGEISRRYSVSLYSLAYGILLDQQESDRVVARALSELRRDAIRGLAAPFPVRWWLAETTRAHAQHLRRHHPKGAGGAAPQTDLPPPPPPERPSRS